MQRAGTQQVIPSEGNCPDSDHHDSYRDDQNEAELKGSHSIIQLNTSLLGDYRMLISGFQQNCNICS